MSGGNYLEGNCPGIIIRGKIIQAQIFMVAILLKAIVWGKIIRDVIIRGGGAIVQEPHKQQHVYGLLSSFSNSYNICGPYPFIKYAYTSLKQSYKTPVKKDLMRIILFRTYKHLKLSVILYIFHVLIIFLIYQTVRSLPSKIESLCSEFCKWF